MELKWLEDFLALCKYGNFRISSEQRFVSQPAFSRRIKSLESWLGASLIDRSSQPVQLTQAGELFKPVAQEIVRLARQSLENIEAESLRRESKIRFSTLNSLAQFFMPTWLKQLQPLIETKLFSVRTNLGHIDNHLSELEEGTIDFFICYEDPSGTKLNDTQRYSSIHLGVEKLVAVVAPDSDGNPAWWLPANPSGVIPYLHTTSTPTTWPIKNHLKKHYGHLNFKTVYETCITSAIKAMVIEGYGVAWVPYSVVADDLANSTLVRAGKKEDDIAVNIKIYKCVGNEKLRAENFWRVLLQNNANLNVPD